LKNNFAVDNRCAIDPDGWGLSAQKDEIIRILKQQGFKIIGSPDIICTARALVGKSKYARAARPSEAPGQVDCSSLVKWVYGRWGIWLPRRTVQQREYGQQICFSDLSPGDLVFTKGLISYHLDDPRTGVGHVGIYTGNGTVIQAASKKTGITETPLNIFMDIDNFRGVRRIISKDRQIITVVVPADREIETADDIKWIVVQSLPKKMKQ
jgi:hypothetical protein